MNIPLERRRWSCEPCGQSHLTVLKEICKEESRKNDYLRECISVAKTCMHSKSQKKPSVSDDEISSLFDEAEKTSRPILTPFDALAGFSRGAPSYWISSSFAYDTSAQQVDMTIRQTGVLPSYINRLTLRVSFVHKSRTQDRQVVLRQSMSDTSFKSSTISFSVHGEEGISEASVVFKIYDKKRIFKRKAAEWKASLNTYSSYKTNILLQRISFEK